MVVLSSISKHVLELFLKQILVGVLDIRVLTYLLENDVYC